MFKFIPLFSVCGNTSVRTQTLVVNRPKHTQMQDAAAANVVTYLLYCWKPTEAVYAPESNITPLVNFLSPEAVRALGEVDDTSVPIPNPFREAATTLTNAKLQY